MAGFDPDFDGPGEAESPKMPAGFGLATATFVVVSSMVGTGVLMTSGYTVAGVGSNQLMLALWVVGGVVALCGALSLAELSAAIPATGGDYIYLREAYGPLAGFLSGWASFLLGFAAPIAASASASASYLLAPLGLGGGRPGSRTGGWRRRRSWRSPRSTRRAGAGRRGRRGRSPC